MDLLASWHTNQCQHYYTLEDPLPLEALGLNAFNHPWKYQVIYVFPPPPLVLLVLSRFPAEHVIGQFRLLILVAHCWNKAPYLPAVLNTFEYISHWCPSLNILKMNLFVDQVLMGVPLLHLILWLFIDACCTDKHFFPQSVSQRLVLLEHLQQKITSTAEKNGTVGVLEGMYQTMPFLPLYKLIFWLLI